MSAKEVSHRGKIVSVGDGKVSVQIVSESACASCHASGLCGALDSKKKIVEVPVSGTGSFAVGQDVEVCLGLRTGLKAVLFSYVLPLAVLLVLILVLSGAGLNELVCGLASIAGVAVYYLLLYFCRDRLAEGYVFYIKE